MRAVLLVLVLLVSTSCALRQSTARVADIYSPALRALLLSSQDDTRRAQRALQALDDSLRVNVRSVAHGRAIGDALALLDDELRVLDIGRAALVLTAELRRALYPSTPLQDALPLRRR